MKLLLLAGDLCLVYFLKQYFKIIYYSLQSSTLQLLGQRSKYELGQRSRYEFGFPMGKCL